MAGEQTATVSHPTKKALRLAEQACQGRLTSSNSCAAPATLRVSATTVKEALVLCDGPPAALVALKRSQSPVTLLTGCEVLKTSIQLLGGQFECHQLI